jgi:hypothetical protein
MECARPSAALASVARGILDRSNRPCHCGCGAATGGKAPEGWRTAMSCVKHRRSFSRFCFFIKRCFLVFLSVRLRAMKRFPGGGKRRQPLLFLLSVHGPAGTAPNDSCGHSQETGAPNLQTGPLPAPVRFRARAVSNCLGRSLAWWWWQGKSG